MPRVQAITPCLWFDDQAEEAARVGIGVFPNSRITKVLRYNGAGEEIHGQHFATLNGDPDAQQCGWLKDRFGVSWQVTPRILLDMLADPDPAGSRRSMEEVLKVKKFDIAALERVHGS